MKRIANTITLLVLLLVWACPVLAQEEVMDFQKALQMALKNNIDIQIAQLTLENSEIDVKKSELQTNADTRAQQLNLELEMAKSKNTYANARYNLIVGLINDFAELTKKRLTVEVNEKTLRVKEIELKTTNDLYNKGNATNTDLKSARSTVDEQKITLEKSKEELARLLTNIGFKISANQVKFKELQVTVAKLTLDQAKSISDAEIADFDLKNRKISLQLAELELEKGQLEQRPELELKKLANNKELARLRVVQTQDALVKEVQDLFWNLDQQYKSLTTKETDLEVAKTNYQQIAAGYKKGHYTETQLLQSQISQLNAEKALFTAKIDYILKKAQLLHRIGQGQLIGGELK